MVRREEEEKCLRRMVMVVRRHMEPGSQNPNPNPEPTGSNV